MGWEKIGTNFPCHAGGLWGHSQTFERFGFESNGADRKHYYGLDHSSAFGGGLTKPHQGIFTLILAAFFRELARRFMLKSGKVGGCPRIRHHLSDAGAGPCICILRNETCTSSLPTIVGNQPTYGT